MTTFTDTPTSTDVFRKDLFDDETVLITGGGTGIGKHIALGFAAHGADVAIASRNMDHLEPVVERVEEQGVAGCAVTVDIREPESVAEMTATVLDELGDISVLVNNAGANFISPFEEISPNGWRSVVGTILDGTAYCTAKVGEHMIERGGGAIISMGSTNSVRGAPFHAHSGAGKAGVHNLMQSVAVEWAEHGIRANTVAPGVVATEGLTEAMGGSFPDEFLEEIAADRYASSEDCVPITLFLASEAAAYVTGQYFVVDGGQLLDVSRWR